MSPDLLLGVLRATAGPLRSDLIRAMPTPEWERFEAFLWSTSSLLVVAEGEETAAKVASGAADRSVQRAVEAYGFVPSGSPRVDKTFARGSTVSLGEIRRRDVSARRPHPRWQRLPAS
jgi:hypothetical protein